MQTFQQNNLTKQIRGFIDKRSILNADQFTSLLEDPLGVQHVVNIAKYYTNNINGLIEKMLQIYPDIEDKSLKIKCKKLRKQLGQIYINPSSDDSCF